MSCAPPDHSTPLAREKFADGPLPAPAAENLSFRPGAPRMRPHLACSGGRREPAETELSGEDARHLYKWVSQLSVLLTEMRGRFGGDLDQYLIYMVFMLTQYDCRPGGDGLNVFSVAEITGIPRETVRRKLATMAARGEVQRGEDGLYRPGPSASLPSFFRDLARLNRAVS